MSPELVQTLISQVNLLSGLPTLVLGGTCVGLALWGALTTFLGRR